MSAQEHDGWPCNGTLNVIPFPSEDTMDKRVYIMRGLPGMGKSDMVDIITAGRGGNVKVCSADKYRMKKDPDTGTVKYVFKVEETPWCHMKCQKSFESAVRKGVRTIILDNTNTRQSEYAIYKRIALSAGYKVFEVIVGTLDTEASFERNTHDVPKDTIDAMAERFEFPSPTGSGPLPS